MTFVQFVFVASTGYVSQFDRSRPPFFLKQNRVPIRRWLINILLFFTINVLNNHAFSYNISVPIHIILRSGGSITTLAAGYIWGKRFTRVQVVAVTLLTIGVVIAAWSDQASKVSCVVWFITSFANISSRKTWRVRKVSLHLALDLPSSSLPKCCQPSWVYILRRHIKNMGPIGRRTCSTRIYSLFPCSYPFCPQ